MSVERFVTGTIELLTAVHIGTGRDNSKAADAPVRRTGDGRLFIPGRALGGSLRTLATRIAPRLGLQPCQSLAKKPRTDAPCPCEVCKLFGNIHPVEAQSSQSVKSEASRLWVYDAFVSETKPTHVRDGVGIDRSRGAAKAQVKFDYEVIPAGTKFDFKLRWTTADLETDALLVAILAEWEAGRGQIGGNVARGLGQFRLDEVAYTQTKLDSADELIAYLQAEHPEKVGKPIGDKWADCKRQQARDKLKARDKNSGVTGVAAGFIAVELTLSFSDFFLINDPLIGLISDFDHAPLVEFLPGPGEAGQPVLSGASLRGALRSHAEKIARTLATNYWFGQAGENAGEKFLENCPACDVLARDEESPLTSCDTRLIISDKEETPEEALCLSCRLFGSQRRGSRLWVRDACLVGDTPKAKDWKAQDFLAIDRFTGGGVDGAKFNAAPLLQAKFKGEIVLHDPAAWELGWLALLLRDLYDGHLTIGFGAAKGYGRVQAKDITWRVGYLTEDDYALFPPLAPRDENQPGLYFVSTNSAQEGWLPDGWLEKAQEWVDEFNRQVKGFERDDNWQRFSRDTFFAAYWDDAEVLQRPSEQLLQLYGISRPEVKDNE